MTFSQDSSGFYLLRKNRVGHVGQLSNTHIASKTPETVGESSECLSVGHDSEHAPETRNCPTPGQHSQKPPTMHGFLAESGVGQPVQHVQHAATGIPKKVRIHGGKSQIGLFEMLDIVGHDDESPDDPDPPPANRCETCRHWRTKPPVLKPSGERVPHEWKHCRLVYVVTKRRYGSGIEAGTVVTPEEANALSLAVDFLNTAPHFTCAQWQAKAEPNPMDIWRDEEDTA